MSIVRLRSSKLGNLPSVATRAATVIAIRPLPDVSQVGTYPAKDTPLGHWAHVGDSRVVFLRRMIACGYVK
jgi:hypothetical protein